MNFRTTLVTMYFNLKNLPDATTVVRPESFYMEKGKAILEINSPMVIFCDNTTHSKIKEMRDSLVPNASEKTTYVVRRITDYDMYKLYFPIIEKNRIPFPGYKKSRVTSSAFILYMFKTVAVLMAKQMNVYKTPFYAWIDFGGSHVMRNFTDHRMKILENPNPKISCCYIHYRGKDELASMANFVNPNSEGCGKCGIASTLITYESEYIERYYNGMMSVFHEMLFKGCGHAEEQCMTYVYDRNPEIFTIYYGDYYSTASNYHTVHDDYDSIRRYFILPALHKGRSDLAIACAKTVLKSIEIGSLLVNPSEIEWLKDIKNGIFNLSPSDKEWIQLIQGY